MDFYIVCSRKNPENKDKYCIIKSITMENDKITKIEGACVSVGAGNNLQHQIETLYKLVKEKVEENIPLESIIGARFEVVNEEDKSGTQIIKN